MTYRKAWMSQEKIQGIASGPRYQGYVEVDDDGELMPDANGDVLFKNRKGGERLYPAASLTFTKPGENTSPNPK